jgi:hypothetical protein
MARRAQFGRIANGSRRRPNNVVLLASIGNSSGHGEMRAGFNVTKVRMAVEASSLGFLCGDDPEQSHLISCNHSPP